MASIIEQRAHVSDVITSKLIRRFGSAVTPYVVVRSAIGLATRFLFAEATPGAYTVYMIALEHVHINIGLSVPKNIGYKFWGPSSRKF